MNRRGVKKRLRRAEDAFFAGRYAEAEAIYRFLLEQFEQTPPSLLDHIAAIYGLVQCLHWQGHAEQAAGMANRADGILSARRPILVAA